MQPMQTTPPKSSPTIRARRGMTAILVKQHSEWHRDDNGHLLNTIRPEYEIVEVTSVSRDGWINRYRNCWGNEVAFNWARAAYAGYSILVPDVDTEQARAVATAHHWPGHPNQPKPYETLEEVKAALQPLRRKPEHSITLITTDKPTLTDPQRTMFRGVCGCGWRSRELLRRSAAVHYAKQHRVAHPDAEWDCC